MKIEYNSLYTHFVFVTYQRQTLISKSSRVRIEKYITGIVNNNSCKLYAIYANPEHLHFLVPRTFGEGGYWTEFDWDKALRIGSEHNDLAYSGSYDFAATAMYWPLSHMVSPKERALQCTDCHGSGGRMD